ncbi:MAG TPA: pyridoxal phosphate-dependent aminotransferase [Terriglobia bacterium]
MFARRTEWPLEPNALTREIESRRHRGLPVLDLTESNPTRCGFHYDSDAILRALASSEALSYQPDPRGLLSARRAVAAYYAEGGVVLDPEQIFLTASTSEAYSYLFRLLADAGDAVLVPQPSYPLFDFLAGLSDLEIIPYPLTYDAAGWRIDLEELAARLGGADRTFHFPRALVVVHPNNPTGSFVHDDQLAGLVDLCVRHNLALIADEVFLDYDFAAAASPEEGTASNRARSHAGLESAPSFTLSGLSKIAALPQMKLAWIVVSGPQEVRARALARLEIIADTYLSVSGPVASALPDLLETRRVLQPQIMLRVRQNLAELDRQLGCDSQVSRLQVEGGWYAVLRLLAPSRSVRGSNQQGPPVEEAQLADDELSVEVARTDGVLVHPGHFYGFASEGHFVLSLINPSGAFSDGVHKLLAHLEARPS